VQPGDTLLQVSMKFRVRSLELAKVNQLLDDMIYPGQLLKVPDLPDSNDLLRREERMAKEIAKNNQTGTYQIDSMNDMLSQIEEIKMDGD